MANVSVREIMDLVFEAHIAKRQAQLAPQPRSLMSSLAIEQLRMQHARRSIVEVQQAISF